MNPGTVERSPAQSSWLSYRNAQGSRLRAQFIIRQFFSVRILILSTTTGYQLRSFGDAAERAGIELMFATDRCHQLDDPWRDAAVAVRFHEEEASLDAIVAAARARPLDGVIAVGDRPVVLAARA